MSQTEQNRKVTLDGIVSRFVGTFSQKPTIETAGIEIYALSQESYVGIASTPGVLQTVLALGEMVEPHSHQFEAWYFTDGVAHLFTAANPQIELPEYAAIRVAERTVHGWSDVYSGREQGVITHLHVGHGVHKVERVY